jgi:hypothetical protein
LQCSSSGNLFFPSDKSAEINRVLLTSSLIIFQVDIKHAPVSQFRDINSQIIYKKEYFQL